MNEKKIRKSFYFRHTGLVVGDINKAKHFWINGFGFHVTRDVEEDQDFIGSLLPGAPRALRTIKLEDENGSCLELLQYGPPESTHRWEGSPNRIGLNHLAITVSSIKETLATLTHMGCKAIAPIQVTPDRLHRVVYCEGPEGLLLELVEPLGVHNE